MAEARRIVYDAKTGKKRVETFDFTPQPAPPEPEPVDLNDLRKLIEHAKSEGWI